MRRIIVHDEINTAYGNRTNELSKDIFQRNFELLRRSKLFRTFPNSAFFNKLFEFCGKLQISGKYLCFWRKNIGLKFKVAKTSFFSLKMMCVCKKFKNLYKKTDIPQDIVNF